MFLKLIPWNALKLVAVVLLAVSTATSITGLYVVSISETVTNSLTLGMDDFLIISSASKTPHTGMVADLSNHIGGAEGVGLVSPEILAPVVVGGKAAFLRGVNVTSFKELGIVKHLIGSWPESPSEVLVGSRAGAYLGVSVGDSITITGVPTGKEVEVVVRGIYASGTPLDDELLGTLPLAKVLRGIQGSYVTLIRVRSGGHVNMSLIPNYLSPKAESSNIPSSVLRGLKVVGGGGELLDEVLGRGVKISSNFLWSSALLVITASALTIYYGVSWMLGNLNCILITLRFVGLSRYRLALLVIVKLLIVSAASCVAGYLTGYSVLKLIFDLLGPQVLLHTVELVSDLRVLLLSTLVPSLIAASSVLVRVREL